MNPDAFTTVSASMATPCFGREGYKDAGAALAHLQNVGALLAEFGKITELERLEVHGIESELAKLRGPLADFKPQYFTLEYGFRR